MFFEIMSRSNSYNCQVRNTHVHRYKDNKVSLRSKSFVGKYLEMAWVKREENCEQKWKFRQNNPSPFNWKSKGLVPTNLISVVRTYVAD